MTSSQARGSTTKGAGVAKVEAGNDWETVTREEGVGEEEEEEEEEKKEKEKQRDAWRALRGQRSGVMVPDLLAEVDLPEGETSQAKQPIFQRETLI